MIRFTNLPPGRNIPLHVRAVSREEHDIVFQERTMKIIITQPFLVELVGYLMLYPVGNRGILFRSAGDKSEKAKEYI